MMMGVIHATIAMPMMVVIRSDFHYHLRIRPVSKNA